MDPTGAEHGLSEERRRRAVEAIDLVGQRARVHRRNVGDALNEIAETMLVGLDPGQ